MAENVILNNYSDDSQIKKFMAEELAPRVFHDIPLTVLNTGFFNLVSEYISQITEQLSFTSSFYFNESFITKAVLPDSIYSEAAIFNIGYSFATPASTSFLLELKIEDIYNNAVKNVDTGMYEFVLDKDTKFNLPEGYTYSLDYDILIQYKDTKTSSIDASIPAWNVQYINRDVENYCATNKNVYITYRVTDVWLCLLIQANEYERETHVVVNNTTNGIPNEDTVITCDNHIAGFDIKYIDNNGNESWIPHDHILAMHDSVKDNNPYVHYIMDNPQTIRFMWQLNGNKHFVPPTNSSFEITIYTCHGKAANAPNYKNEKQPNVITSSNKYTNNANVMKAAFVISGCVGGADIGTTETVRRETIEAYNTANVLSTDHDIDEYFKTFYFKNILYPYFFKRRDDPWGRIWSGYIALNDNDDYVYRTNTLHAQIRYEELYNNANNSISNNEIIIPPGWIWVYSDGKGTNSRWTVVPYTQGDGTTIETVSTLASINEKFIFANPFGIRIQKDPFAIGYFNPWVNEYVTATKINTINLKNDNNDLSVIYHATPIMTNVKRTYKDDNYTFTSHILPTIPGITNSDGIGNKKLVEYLRVNAVEPLFTSNTWNYFNKPFDMYAENIPMLPINGNTTGYIPYDPNKTFLCVKTKSLIDDDKWLLNNIWIEDESTGEKKIIDININAEGMYLFGSEKVWGKNGINNGHEVYMSGETDIELSPVIKGEPITFSRVTSQNYYTMRLSETAELGTITKIIVGEAVETDLTKYGEKKLIKIGKSYSGNTYINIFFAKTNEDGTTSETQYTYTISNAANIYIPYMWNEDSPEGSYVFNMSELAANDVILYADMRPAPDSGSVDYFRVPLSDITSNTPVFFVHSNQLPVYKNNMRVIMHTIINGSETGRAEMQPVSLESDGSYVFETKLYPLTELIDIDNRITIASEKNGGGSWHAMNGETVSIDALDPQIKITILIKSDDEKRDSEIEIGDTYTGYRIIDEYMLDDLDLVQELKEMRSVVNFGDSSMPTMEQMLLYHSMYEYDDYNEKNPHNFYYVRKFCYNKMNEIADDSSMTYEESKFDYLQKACADAIDDISSFKTDFEKVMTSGASTEYLDVVITLLDTIINSNESDIDWSEMYNFFDEYKDNINKMFSNYVNISDGVEIQLVPFVEHSLMNSDRFENFVSSFTQVHKAIEPVIFKRLEGNHYLDCKLIATYGLPHTYSSDINIDLPETSNDAYWPDLNVQLEFDVKLYNQSLATNTINELRLIVRSYFNRITSLHTPTEALSMDNNIYISNVIQQMEEHDNVAYLKFKGWYTNEKYKPDGNYMDANTQAIVQRYKKLEDLPSHKLLEAFTPEMFVMDDDDIVINIIK